jgi:hypothetical protein
MAVTLLFLLALLPGGEVIDRIMAVVGQQPITLSEVTAASQFQIVEVPPGAADPAGSTLERLIDRTLMLTEVDRFLPPEPDPIEITLRVDQMQARAGSAEEFARSLAVTGTTLEQLRRLVRDNLRIATYLNQRFGTLIDPAERRAAIDGWIGELRHRAQITVLNRPAAPPRGPSR